MICTLNTAHVTPDLRPMLLLLLELITESPVRRNGILMSHEEVVTALEKDTISLGTRIGLESNAQFSCGPFSNNATVMLQVEPKKYQLGVDWLVNLLHNTEFTADRIRVTSSKIVNAVAQAKRKGNSIVSDLLKALYYAEGKTFKYFFHFLYK